MPMKRFKFPLLTKQFKFVMTHARTHASLRTHTHTHTQVDFIYNNKRCIQHHWPHTHWRSSSRSVLLVILLILFILFIIGSELVKILAQSNLAALSISLRTSSTSTFTGLALLALQWLPRPKRQNRHWCIVLEKMRLFGKHTIGSLYNRIEACVPRACWVTRIPMSAKHPAHGNWRESAYNSHVSDAAGEEREGAAGCVCLGGLGGDSGRGM